MYLSSGLFELKSPVLSNGKFLSSEAEQNLPTPISIQLLPSPGLSIFSNGFSGDFLLTSSEITGTFDGGTGALSKICFNLGFVTHTPFS